MADTTKLHALAVYLRRAGQPSNAAQVQEAADHIDGLTSELEQLRLKRTEDLRLVTIGMAEREWAAAADICIIPESAFHDYPARDNSDAPDAVFDYMGMPVVHKDGSWRGLADDCQSDAAQRMAHSATDTFLDHWPCCGASLFGDHADTCIMRPRP